MWWDIIKSKWVDNLSEKKKKILEHKPSFEVDVPKLSHPDDKDEIKEYIRGEGTDESAIERAVKYYKKLGPIIQRISNKKTISFIEITPLLLTSSLSTIKPVGSTIAEIPLFADLKVYLPYSIDLKILCAKC